MTVRNSIGSIRPVDQIEPLAISVITAKRVSGLGATTIWKLISSGALKTVHIGRRTLIVYESLQALLLNSENKPTKKRVRRYRQNSPRA